MSIYLSIYLSLSLFRNYFPSNLDGSAQMVARVSVSLPSCKPLTSQTDSH